MTCPRKVVQRKCDFSIYDGPLRAGGGVVRKSRFNEEQIIAILKEAEGGIAPDELCRRHGITRGSLYR